MRWCATDGKIVAKICCVMSLLLIALAAVMYFYVIPTIVHRMVIENSKLVEGSMIIDIWKNPKYKQQFKVHPFFVMNPEEILNGSTPIVKELGAYVFDKTINNEVISSGNGVVNFKRKTVYHFNKEDSCKDCSLDDRLWVPNLMYQKFVEVASREETREGAQSLLANSPFIQVSMDELVFNGYTDPYFETFCFLPLFNTFCKNVFDLPDRVGLFYGYNNSYIEGEFTIADGTFDIAERGRMIVFNHKNEFPENWWDNAKARVLRSNEGSLFPPFIRRDDILHTFARSLCRQSLLSFGALAACEMSTKDEPAVVLSFPHFNGVEDKEVINSVRGLIPPDDDEDSITVDIEPTLGLPIKARRRIQINMEFWAGKNIPLPAWHSRQKSVLIPMAIIHDDAEIDDSTLTTVKRQFICPHRLANVMCWCIFVFALLLFIASIVFLLMKWRRMEGVKE